MQKTLDVPSLTLGRSFAEYVNDLVLRTAPLAYLYMRAGHTLKQAAYEEYKVTRQCSTGNGDLYVAQWDVPGWFVYSELGFGTGEGPSLRYTLAMLPTENPRRLARLKAREMPPRTSVKLPKKRESKWHRLAAFQSLAQSAMRDGYGRRSARRSARR